MQFSTIAKYQHICNFVQVVLPSALRQALEDQHGHLFGPQDITHQPMPDVVLSNRHHLNEWLHPHRAFKKM